MTKARNDAKNHTFLDELSYLERITEQDPALVKEFPLHPRLRMLSISQRLKNYLKALDYNHNWSVEDRMELCTRAEGMLLVLAN